MSDEINMVIQLVDKVVKPLSHIQTELALTREHFNRLKEEWGGLNYQSLELYERWQEQEQFLSDNISELTRLVKVLERTGDRLTSLESELDSKIYTGILKGSKKLTDDFRRSLFEAVKAEVHAASEGLSTIAKKSTQGLETYQAITFWIHLKYMLLALMIGVLSGMGTFLVYRYSIHTQAPCECILKKIEGVELKSLTRSKFGSEKPQF